MNGIDTAAPQVGFIYENDAYIEPQKQPNTEAPPSQGVFGRHVANGEFLSAWLAHGDWSRVVAIVANQVSGESLRARFESHPRSAGDPAKLDIVPLQRFHDRFFPKPPVEVLHVPQPIDSELAWVRHHKAPHSFALSGVTHTLSLKEVMQRFTEVVSAPFEEYDTLFCISRASLEVVRTVTDNYAAYLRERFGGAPRRRMRLEVLPFGVDTKALEPATPQERLAVRSRLGIAADAVCVLYVGRLSYASKVHPFPMYRAITEAARQTGREVHVVVAGWAESPSILQKFQQGAQALASGFKMTFVDGLRAGAVAHVWKAADIFTSLSDNIQETLGLTILEAQACGLPVVTSDWDGCRDSVEDGVTGFAVPTHLVTGATEDSTSRHLVGETSNGVFLGETNQSVAVDVPLATQAFVRLFSEPQLCQQMGARGRARVLERYTWPSIIERYGTIWREQELVRREHAAASAKVAVSEVRTPVIFPDVEHAFAAYPSSILGMDARVVAADDAAQRLPALLGLPITSYVARARVSEPGPLAALLHLAAAPADLGQLEAALGGGGSSRQRARATLAWMLKYDLLRLCS